MALRRPAASSLSTTQISSASSSDGDEHGRRPIKHRDPRGQLDTSDTFVNRPDELSLTIEEAEAVALAKAQRRATHNALASEALRRRLLARVWCRWWTKTIEAESVRVLKHRSAEALRAAARESAQQGTEARRRPTDGVRRVHHDVPSSQAYAAPPPPPPRSRSPQAALASGRLPRRSMDPAPVGGVTMEVTRRRHRRGEALQPQDAAPMAMSTSDFARWAMQPSAEVRQRRSRSDAPRLKHHSSRSDAASAAHVDAHEQRWKAELRLAKRDLSEARRRGDMAAYCDAALRMSGTCIQLAKVVSS